ncbi:MAG: glycosyltransferase [Candidatus Thermoplasmatota archaeon]
MICGPCSESGGVSIHTRNLYRELVAKGVHADLCCFSQGEAAVGRPRPSRVYFRSIGLALHLFRHHKTYDVVHVQASGGVLSFIGAVTAAYCTAILNKRLVVGFHHGRSASFIRTHRLLFGTVLARADSFVAISQKMACDITHAFPWAEERVVYIPNAYDQRLFHQRNQADCRRHLNLPHSAKMICNVSNLLEVKGQSVLIDALGRLKQKHQDTLCVIIGEGPMESNLRNQVTELDLAESVLFTGKVPHEDIPRWIGAADVVVISSISEGNPTVLFEAFGSGRPVISTRVGGIPEIIVHEFLGSLYDASSPTELSAQIEVGLSRAWDCRRIAEYGSKYSWSLIANRYIDIYMTVAKSKPTKVMDTTDS